MILVNMEKRLRNSCRSLQVFKLVWSKETKLTEKPDHSTPSFYINGQFIQYFSKLNYNSSYFSFDANCS